MRNLEVAPLTAAVFAPFGDVIETQGRDHYTINEGTTERYHDLANIDVGEGDGQPLVSIFQATPRPVPITIKMMERHPLGSQAFMPLSVQPYLVVVAGPGDEVDAGTLKAFITNGRQGVNYAKNTWHHPVLALSEVCDFLVIDRGGPGDNLQEYYFPEELALNISL